MGGGRLANMWTKARDVKEDKKICLEGYGEMAGEGLRGKDKSDGKINND